MKDMQRIEILFREMSGRFDVLEERFNGFETEIKPLLARIPFIERKLDRIKVVVGGHSSQLLNHESRINRLEHRPRLLRDGERDV